MPPITLSQIQKALGEVDRLLVAFNKAHPEDCPCDTCAMHGEVSDLYDRAGCLASNEREALSKAPWLRYQLASNGSRKS